MSEDAHLSDDLAEYRLLQLETKVAKLEQEIHEIENSEKQKLKWGISVLGGALLTVVGIIWSYRNVIFRG